MVPMAAKSGRHNRSRGVDVTRLRVATDVADRLERAAAQRGRSRDSFADFVLELGLQALETAELTLPLAAEEVRMSA